MVSPIFIFLCRHLYGVSFIDLYSSTWDLYLFFGGQKNLDEAHSSPGLHASAGPGLAEECTTLVGSFVQIEVRVWLVRTVEVPVCS